MPYTIQPIVMPDVTSDCGQSSNALHGWPAVPFNYLLLSEWICLGTLGRSANASSSTIFSLTSNNSSVRVGLMTGAFNPMYDGIFDADLSNYFQHVLVSADALTQRVQVYVNDVPVSLTSGPGWTQHATFNVDAAYNHPGVGVSSGAGMADFYATAPASFFDLTITANRRKFINADLSPVDLGTNASSVTGTPPIDYLTVRPGGVATDFTINYGTGGAFANPGTPLAFLTPGSCPMPVGPGGPGGGGGIIPPPPPRLAIDNVVATALGPQPEVNLVSLRFSDDRGHSWGSPITQDIGEAGEYRTSLQWNRLGMARDRCWEISWSVPMRTALQGCWVDVTPAQS